MVSCRTGGRVIGSLLVEAVQLRGRLARRDRVVGTVLTLPDVALAELTAHAADFVWIDLEHGALGAGDIQPLAIAARSAGAAVLVRLPSHADAVVERALDAGVDGVVVPRVESAAHAELVAAMLRPPPAGSRGAASRRASAYGLEAPASDAPLCLVQIESADAIGAATEIAAVDGVDALVVGCADLALSLGAASPPAEVVREAIARVQLAAEDAGIASGVAGPDDPGLLLQLADERSTMLVLGADVRVYARAMATALGALRRDPPHPDPAPEEAHVGA